MTARHRSLLGITAGVLACVVLALSLHASRSRAANLREQLAMFRPTSPDASVLQPAAAAVTSPDGVTKEQGELAEWTALLEAARRVPEVARREAALRVIKRIQATHAEGLTKPRALPPPTPRDGQFFAELLDDPEYLQLVAQRWHLMQGRATESRLARQGIPEALRSQIVALEFDSHTAGLDVQRFARHDEAERRAAIMASQKVRADNDTAIKQLLGDEAFAAYRERAPLNVVPTRIPDSVLEPLARRLSYSAAPLDPNTRTQLTELLQSMSSSPSALYAMPRTPEFIDRARGILQPAQVAALEELRVEYEAARARSRLPKSSELPRTTRRQRFESASN